MSASPTEGTDMNQIEKALSDYLGDMCGMRLNPHALTGLAKAAIAAMQPAPQWQGIESAPRDGRAILVGCWVGSRWSWWQTFSDGGPLGNDGEFGDEPTHWADAPTPPAGGSDAE